MTYSLKYFATMFLLILFSTSVSAQLNTAKAEAEIQSIMKDLEAVGLSVAVVKKGKIIYTHSFGLKDKESNTPLADNDIFRIASISKSFTATAIMQLVETNKLSLDDDISKLIGFKIRNPKFPETVITLKMLMSHTSSLNDSQGYFNLDSINPDKNSNSEKCYNNYEPGKNYQYCNLNYNLTGAVLEKYSGERFDNYIVNHILKPLDLYGGYCIDSLDAKRFVTLYEYDSQNKSLIASPSAYNSRPIDMQTYKMGYSTPVFSPTGGLKISATDLAKDMIMHMNYGKANGVRIISKKSAKLMQTTVYKPSKYGLALTTTDNLIPGEILKGHTGSAYGLYSAMFFQPEEKFGIVVITNGCNPKATDGFQDLVRLSINSLYNNFIKK